MMPSKRTAQRKPKREKKYQDRPDRTSRGPQEDHHEATQRSSRAISSPGDSPDQSSIVGDDEWYKHDKDMYTHLPCGALVYSSNLRYHLCDL
jgi:hypothetical protein